MSKIKILISIALTVSSCSSVDNSYFGYFQNYISGNKIEINDDLIKRISYSFIKVSLGRNDAIFVLSTVDDLGIYTWVGSNYEIIKTYKGLVVFSNIPDMNFDLISSNINFDFTSNAFTLYGNLYDPDLYHQSIHYKLVSRVQNAKGYMNTYLKTIKAINWEVTEKVQLNQRGLVIESEQFLNPLKKKLVVNYYYQF